MLRFQAMISFLVLALPWASQAVQPAPNFSTFQGTSTLQRIHQGVPFARSCFQNATTAGSTNSTDCKTIQSNYGNHLFRMDQFGSFMNTQWETCQATSQECLLDNHNPSNAAAFAAPSVCSQGSVPDYYIEVQTTKDIQLAFTFSKATKVPLSIKNTGHDYKGRSAGPQTVSIWTHNLQSMSFRKTFQPQNCKSVKAQPALTFGAGVTWGQLYDFAQSHNVTIPGASDTAIGAAGGYLQGGGHGSLSPVYGLFVDRVLEFEVVVPKGDVLVANACQNSDLFFALRGGGGGTFGVVTKATSMAFPRVPITSVSVTYPTSATSQTAFMQFIANFTMTYANEGWGGHITPGTGLTLSTSLRTPAQAAQTFAPLKDFVTNQLNGNFTITQSEDFLAFFQQFVIPSGVPVGLPFTTATRLIPATVFQSATQRDQLVSAVNSATQAGGLVLILVNAPFKHGNLGGTSVTPAWYNSVWHTTISGVWTFNTTLPQRQAVYNSLTKSANALRAFTPNSGAYQNEADVFEPNHEASFWGSNYQRLLQIKQKYDPNHLLDCWHCVGFLGTSNSRYKCYPTES